MTTPHDLVMEFHQTYSAPIGDFTNPDIARARNNLRIRLIAEEFIELLEAVYGKDIFWYLEEKLTDITDRLIPPYPDEDNSEALVGVADALGDLVYVIYGYAIEAGINLDKVLAEIQRSNLSKLDEDGNPIVREDGKILKGPNYSPPDIAAVLETQRG